MALTDEDLHRIPLFASLQNDDLGRLQSIARFASFQRGETIFQEGDHADGMYVLAEGKVEVRKQAKGTENHEVLATLEPFAMFGEMTLVHENGMQRSATVHAIEPGSMIKIDKDQFRKLVQDNDPIAMAILTGIVQVLSERLTKIDQELLQFIKVAEPEAGTKLADLTRFRDKVLSEWTF